MGFPPPPDAPSIDDQASVSADASFGPSPTGTTICGFAIPPTFSFNISFKLPGIGFEFPPKFFFGLSLNCDLSDPIDAEFGFGGGRVSSKDPDADDEQVVD